jgi:hypothetical protein
MIADEPDGCKGRTLADAVIFRRSGVGHRRKILVEVCATPGTCFTPQVIHRQHDGQLLAGGFRRLRGTSRAACLGGFTSAKLCPVETRLIALDSAFQFIQNLFFLEFSWQRHLHLFSHQ